MVVLTDSNVLLRLSQPLHAHYASAEKAIKELRKKGNDLCLAPQNLVEFWVVATRPQSNNGLGMTVQRAASELLAFGRIFRLLEGKTGVSAAWEKLVNTHSISGKLAHDAHLVAVMQVYSVTSILTFNGSDFRRFPGLTVLDPAQF